MHRTLGMRIRFAAKLRSHLRCWLLASREQTKDKLDGGRGSLSLLATYPSSELAQHTEVTCGFLSQHRVPRLLTTLVKMADLYSLTLSSADCSQSCYVTLEVS